MLREINERSVMIWLSLLGRPNSLIYDLLLEEFGSAEGIYNARLSSIRPESLRRHESALKAFNDDQLLKQAADIYHSAESSGMRIISLRDNDYPYRLKNLPCARPIVLYYYGSFDENDVNGGGTVLAVVGSRHCSLSGGANSFSYANMLSRYGVTIVSGMARGCDGAAHRGALKAGGRTVAVLAGGADVVYPPEHRQLYNEIIKTGGAVISESPPGTAPVKQLFPARNRIIAGLSDGVIVVEAAKKSGALITADRALEADRIVFALPGDVRNPMSYGVNELIRQGAVCASDVGVILDEFGISPDLRKPRRVVNGLSQGLPFPLSAVMNAVIQGASDPDEISERTQLDAGEVCSALTLLEIRGLIKNVSMGKYTAETGI